MPDMGDDGSSTPFFTTGQTWYQIFHTSLAGGNKYIGLAHQWMAATLNGLAGADLTEVASELAAGEAELIDHAAFWDDPSGYSNAHRNAMNAIAGVLDAYNNGVIGPGHCDDTSANLRVHPDTHMLSQAYPNPFNPQSQFTLTVMQDQYVVAELYNTLGQRVAVLFSGTVEANQARLVTIDGAGLASGMYVVRLTGERFTDAFRVTLLK